jgi:hypothetical protein
MSPGFSVIIVLRGIYSKMQDLRFLWRWLKNAVFWDVAPCRSCVNRRSSETSVHTRSARCDIRDDGILFSRVVCEDELEECRWKLSWPIWRFYPHIYLDGSVKESTHEVRYISNWMKWVVVNWRDKNSISSLTLNIERSIRNSSGISRVIVGIIM